MFKYENSKRPKTLVLAILALVVNVSFFLAIFTLPLLALETQPTPKRCENIQGLNQQSACILEVEREIDTECAGLSGTERDECATTVRNQESSSGSLDEELRKQREEVNSKNDCINKGSGGLTKENCGIINYLILFVRVLSGLVGIVVVIMIVVRGMQYIVARENPQMTASARQGLLWAVLALIMYLFLFAFLQWLVPGGVI